MSKIYMAVTVCQDRNESIFKPRENAEYSPGYYSYVLPCKAGENLKFALDCIGGLRVAHLCSTKREAQAVADYWNECYKRNGTYFFQPPGQARHAAWSAQVDAERERNLDGGEVIPF